jgi:Maintenance of mitochondrial structure and function
MKLKESQLDMSQWLRKKRTSVKLLLILVIANLVSQTNALTMMDTRIRFVLNFVKEVESGRIVADDALLRDIASMCSRLPAVEGSDFEAEFNKVNIKIYRSAISLF